MVPSLAFQAYSYMLPKLMEPQVPLTSLEDRGSIAETLKELVSKSGPAVFLDKADNRIPQQSISIFKRIGLAAARVFVFVGIDLLVAPIGVLKNAVCVLYYGTNALQFRVTAAGGGVTTTGKKPNCLLLPFLQIFPLFSLKEVL